MICPICKNQMNVTNTIVKESSIVRYRKCTSCDCRRVTEELFKEDIDLQSSEAENFIYDLMELIEKYGYEI